VPNTVELQPMPTDYVVSDGDVVLTVSVGNGQKGRVKAWLEDTVIAGPADGITAKTVGRGPDLVGKTLEVIATVTVTNPMSNGTVVSYLVSGGKGQIDERTTRDGSGVGDTIEHHAKFVFEASE
jgi:hypothetical protein